MNADSRILDAFNLFLDLHGKQSINYRFTIILRSFGVTICLILFPIFDDFTVKVSDATHELL